MEYEAIFSTDNIITLMILLVVPALLADQLIASLRGKQSYARQLLKRLAPSKPPPGVRKLKEFLRETFTEGRVGIYLNPFMMIVLRWVFSAFLGLIAVGVAMSLDLLLLTFTGITVVDRWVLTGVFLLGAYWLFKNREGVLKLPIAKGLMLTILGIPIRVYLENGDYDDWFRKDPLIGFTEEVKENFTDQNGLLVLGEIPLAIWDSAEKIEGRNKGQTTLENVAGDGSDVFAQLTITVRIRDPKLTLRSGDPTFDLAERSRAAFRTSISFFTGFDNVRMKTVHGKLMSGQTIVTSYLQKQSGHLISGSVIRDRSGVPMYEVVKKKKMVARTEEEKAEEKAAIEEAIGKFREELRKKANPAQLDLIKDNEEGLDVEVLEIEDALTETADKVGVEVLRASVSNIALSKTVSENANLAASEAFQYEIQDRSAAALVNYQKVLKEGTPADAADDPLHELRLVLGAAQDAKHPGDVRVTYVAGKGGKLQHAAATHASLSDNDS